MCAQRVEVLHQKDTARNRCSTQPSSTEGEEEEFGFAHSLRMPSHGREGMEVAAAAAVAVTAGTCSHLAVSGTRERSTLVFKASSFSSFHSVQDSDATHAQGSLLVLPGSTLEDTLRVFPGRSKSSQAGDDDFPAQ